ncbi:phosphoenolpyruvate carboxykinase (ATP) [Enterococcus sp. BWT-B8]|uniref:phosphoenolpyruvate carboxykinase (ATP) n=1 Tax=Enterococcus sp. BWT-B8 TaxID=2885157 RepID=UPI001E4DD0C4|nr:phosphoenolpyruvate carboxykinase (ATP) [Enterococcus sp. BWT-B8]MCB5950787.1 phosphoenolpyruvate carboxykinase (ATP) [Enterococcus sp. BWT-B8]
MSTIRKYNLQDITKSNPFFSKIKSIIETSFYANNITEVTTIAQAYRLAQQSPGTIVTDLPIDQPDLFGLPENSKILVTNDGEIVGRTASARRIIGQPGIDEEYYSRILREAVYKLGKKECYHSSVGIGLAKEFMLQGHLLLPKGFEGNLYSYLLNFQFFDFEYQKRYQDSVLYNEPDLFLLADPDWVHPDFPNGLVLIDSLHNTAAILGLRYFGELKKAALTLSWSIAHRNGYVACHGGMKQFQLNSRTYTMAAFGLSGSGKSTITLASYHNQPVTVLHDDAFIISKKHGSSIALEPSYFDKTQDYPMNNPAVKHFLTCQNVGVTLNENGKKVLVTEDVRNGNGRTVKSHLATPNRKNYFAEKIDAVYWIMKDDSLPPVVRVDNAQLAALFGVTLATKRSNAEHLTEKTDEGQLVIEPFANPFRCYPLAEDYQDFLTLFEDKISCYILNTGHFNRKKITVKQTLDSIEQIIEEQTEFVPFSPISGMFYLPIPDYLPDFSDQTYLNKIYCHLADRLAFLEEQQKLLAGYNALPYETIQLLKKIMVSLSDFTSEK